ncbi:hypothetical protein PG985_003621 [Apiospora marii]|uniref:Uncharacterized protein n=1 Tax=Apiospora marii TaxID=335849 RepID=A0ABR1SHQ7_9PEZI
MDTDGQVYLGVWTNWSRASGSAVMGATLTTTREHGNFLIAFTAFFVPFVASRFWRIFATLFHQCYSASGPRDAIHHQRQVILRNSSSPESGLVSFIRLVWAWRHARPWLRLLPAALFTFVSTITFTVAGGFSSQISTAGEVLLKGDHCEIATDIHKGNLTQFDASKAYWASFINNVNNYAQQCYTNRSSGLVECARFITDTIPTATMDYEAACPFDDSGVCQQNSSNLRLDTGHMNSNDIFGLNAPRDETLTLRYVLQCASLKTEGRARNTTVSNRNFTTYSYGKRLSSEKWADLNYTYSVPDVETQYARAGGGFGNNKVLVRYEPMVCLHARFPSDINHPHFSSEYFLIYQGYLINESSTFYPDPEVVVRDGDVSLFFLSGNGVGFDTPSEDDWYRVNVVGGTRNIIGEPEEKAESKAFFRPREAASPLGCVEQYQWCRDPASNQCGNLSGLLDALYSAAHWFDLTSEDLDADRPILPSNLGSLFQWAYLVLFNHGAMLTHLIETLGPTSIVSQTQQSFIYRIQDNQWQLDVTQWWHTRLASFQALFVNTAQGSTNSPYRPYTFAPTNEREWDLCHNQKIRSTRHASFSVFGLAFTYALGSLIIVLSFVVTPLLGLLQRRGRYSRYAYLEWESETAIQLHRLAQDQLGHGRWSRCNEHVPVTQPGDLLAPLDITDLTHPVLACANASLEKPGCSPVLHGDGEGDSDNCQEPERA